MGLFDWLIGGDRRETARENVSGDSNDPLRVAVDSVLSVGNPTIVTGRVESGTVSPGDRVAVDGGDVVARIRTVERHHEAVERATPGDYVGLELEGVGPEGLRGADSLHDW